jgi:hypothetical protein
MIGCHHIIEDAQFEALLCFEDLIQIAAPVPREFQKKLFLMAAMCDVPDMTGRK